MIRAVVRPLISDYWNGWLYSVKTGGNAVSSDSLRFGTVSVAEIAAANSEELRNLAWTSEADTWSLGAWRNEELVAVCWLLGPETYRKRGGVFDLAEDDAILAQITTSAEHQGQGIATFLIQNAMAYMATIGVKNLYAMIWHNNVASIRAFRKAGWRPECRFLSVWLRGKRKPITFRLQLAGSVA